MLVYAQVPRGAFHLANHLTMCARAHLKNKNKKSPAWGVFASLTPRHGAAFPKALRGSHVSERGRWCQTWDVYSEAGPSEENGATTAMKTTGSLLRIRYRKLDKKVRTEKVISLVYAVKSVLEARPRGSPQTLSERLSCNHSQR